MLITSYSLKEVLKTLESISFTDTFADTDTQNESLSKALEKLADYAEANRLEPLKQFALNELSGYTDGDPNHAKPYPSYRTVNLDYFDRGGQSITNLNQQYSSYPLLNGLNKLELHRKNGMTLNLPAPVLSFLSQASNCEVRGGHVSPPQLQALFEQIRAEAIKRLNQSQDGF
jgi:hypothetical protein